MEALKDYCTHRLLVVGSTTDLKSFDRVLDPKGFADATDIALVDRSTGRRLWQFVTESPAVPAVRLMSRRWPRLLFLLYYDCEDHRLVGLVRMKDGRLVHHHFKY